MNQKPCITKVEYDTTITVYGKKTSCHNSFEISLDFVTYVMSQIHINAEANTLKNLF